VKILHLHSACKLLAFCLHSAGFGLSACFPISLLCVLCRAFVCEAPSMQVSEFFEMTLSHTNLTYFCMQWLVCVHTQCSIGYKDRYRCADEAKNVRLLKAHLQVAHSCLDASNCAGCSGDWSKDQRKLVELGWFRCPCLKVT
jgi:hypothetical protein